MTDERRLTDDLLVLARQYPRETWTGHERLGDLARFWLERHQMFRQFDAAIRQNTDAAVRREVDLDAYRPWLVRSLNRYLGDLEGHHQVEDNHYFPVFRAAEARLGAGFDLLDADHDAIHHAIEEIVAHANGFLQADPSDPAAVMSALNRFRDGNLELGRGLIRHLDDEEDLVIPLILDRGEDNLGG